MPIRFTLLAHQRCVPPGPSALSECLDYDGSGVPKCQVRLSLGCWWASLVSRAVRRSVFGRSADLLIILWVDRSVGESVARSLGLCLSLIAIANPLVGWMVGRQLK